MLVVPGRSLAPQEAGSGWARVWDVAPGPVRAGGAAAAAGRSPARRCRSPGGALCDLRTEPGVTSHACVQPEAASRPPGRSASEVTQTTSAPSSRCSSAPPPARAPCHASAACLASAPSTAPCLESAYSAFRRPFMAIKSFDAIRAAHPKTPPPLRQPASQLGVATARPVPPQPAAAGRSPPAVLRDPPPPGLIKQQLCL